MTLLSGKENSAQAASAARHNSAQRGADAESAEKRHGTENLPKQDGKLNIVVPETPGGAIQLPKPLFGVVEEMPEVTSLFASPDSAYTSRPVDRDVSELKTPAATEYRTPFGSMNDLSTENTKNSKRTPAPKKKEYRSMPIPGYSPKADRHSRKRRETGLDADPGKWRTENVSPRRKSQSTARTHGRSKSFDKPKGPENDYIGPKSRMFWCRQRSMDLLRTPNRTPPVEVRIVDGLVPAENPSCRREPKAFRLPPPKTRPVSDLSRNTSSSRRNLTAPDPLKPS